MKFLRSWLQEYIVEPLPSNEELASVINKQAFEFEGLEQVGDDTIIEFDIKPNRTHDAQSYWGMAKEIAALFDCTFKKSESKYTIDENLATSKLLSVTAPDRIFSPRVMKRIITDVKVGESPEWLKKKLETLGQRSINNIVDITNFVMLETGQPGHAFDYDKIAGTGAKHVFLRKALAGETIATLDDKTYELTDAMWVWADDEKALDIAGVKGGAASGIDEKTTTIMLSVCTFHPTTIRKTSRPLGLLTDASKRYEQGLSPELLAQAMERLCALIQEIAGGRIAHDVIDLYPRKRNPYLIGVSVNETNRLLGSLLSTADVEDIFRRLRFSYRKVVPREEIVPRATSYIDTPYTYGASISFDCPRTFDCGSFISYLYAQSGIALPRMVQDQFVFGEEVSEQEARPGDIVFSSTGGDGRVEHIKSLGIDQVRQTKQTIDFLPGIRLNESVDHAGIYLGDGKVIHASPMSDKGKVIIETLKDAPKFQAITGFRRLPEADVPRYVVTVPPERLDLIASAFLLNGTAADLIEEIGRVYGYDNIPAVPLAKRKEPEINKSFYYINKVRDILVELGFSEVYTYSLTEKGEIGLANPLASDKGCLRTSLSEGLLKAFEFNSRQSSLLGLKETLIFEIGTVFKKDGEFVELGIMGTNGKAENAAKVLEEKLGVSLQKGHGRSHGLGYFLHLTDYIAELPVPSSYTELAIFDGKRKTFLPISNYPFVLRDIAVWVPAEVESSDVIKLIKEHAGALLVRGDLFDTFSKDGKTSYAYHLVFQSSEKTLSDDDVNAIMTRVTEAINAQEGWKVR